ncbi:MAG: hypothetical protein J0L60_05965 [Ignavibacteria bacterium]|nr:hypothetical protein [Ignavibacteria bacterium]MCA0388966.1 hypothetical protein [Bacteroidota bacterium]
MKIVKFGLVLLLPVMFVLTGCGKKKEAAPATDSVKVEAPAPTVDTTAKADTTVKADTTKKEETKKK